MSNSSQVLTGFLQSTCTRKALFVAAELNVPFKFVPLDYTTGEHKSPEYLKNKQPYGVVPVYEEFNDKNERVFHMYESRAIARYFNHLGHGSLIPTDPHQAALFEQFASTEVGTNYSLFYTILLNRVWGVHKGLTCDDKAVAEVIPKLHTSLQVLNKQLESTKSFLVGDFSLLEVFYIPYFNVLKHTPEWKIIEEYPEVVAWIKRIEARPAWQKVLEGKF